jgi:hypothetical protein
MLNSWAMERGCSGYMVELAVRIRFAWAGVRLLFLSLRRRLLSLDLVLILRRVSLKMLYFLIAHIITEAADTIWALL